MFWRIIIVLSLLASLSINAMENYQITAYKDLLPSCNEKMVTILCMKDNTQILNVPLALLKDHRLAKFFADIIENCCNEDVEEVEVYHIDDGTLRSIIYFMTAANTTNFTEAENDITKCFYALILSYYSKEIRKHYEEIAKYLQFDLLLDAINMLD